MSENKKAKSKLKWIAKPLLVRRHAYISFLQRTETYRSTFDLYAFIIVQLYSFLIMLVGDIMQLRLVFHYTVQIEILIFSAA